MDTEKLIKDGSYSYIEVGEGDTTIIVLHGLMGALNNFEGLYNHFPKKGYRIIIPELPIYELPLLKTNIKGLSSFLKKFIAHKKIEKPILLGNSLGGHIALFYANLYMDSVKGLVLTGSSGLYEQSMGESYPKRGDYEYINNKVREVFYDPETASKETVDKVFEIVNDRASVIRTIALAKNAMKHNMAKDLPDLNVPTCIIWGKNDTVTPPNVAVEFDKLLPDSELFWVDKCGHAPMMEHAEVFNKYLEDWLTSREL